MPRKKQETPAISSSKDATPEAPVRPLKKPRARAEGAGRKVALDRNAVKRTTVSFVTSKELLEELDQRTPGDDSRSNTITRSLASYWAILESALPSLFREFSALEAELITAAVGKTTLDNTHAGLIANGGLPILVRSRIESENLTENIHVEPTEVSAMLHKLESLDRLGALAMTDWASRTWANRADLHQPYADFIG